MAAVVDTISPGRGRPGDLVTINGDGFSPTFGQNEVTFGGVPAGVNVNGEQQLQVVVPFGVPVDQHVPVVVTNLDDASSFTWYWWAKDTVANTATAVLRTKVPGHDEKLRGLARSIKNMNVAEARYFMRLSSKIDLIGDLLVAKGDWFSKAADPLGLRRALAGTAGQPFVSALAGGRFQDRETWTAQWGRQVDSGGVETVFDTYPNAYDVAVPASGYLNLYNVVPFTGQIALLSVRERASASTRINRIEVYVDDVLVYDRNTLDGTFPGLGIRSDHETFYPGVEVTQGQRVSVRVGRNTSTTTCNVLVYLVVA